MQIASFFTGLGGLDEGFRKAGFDVTWANENHRLTLNALRVNNPNLDICSDSISSLVGRDIPPVDGFIGGPPCQSWSIAGAHRGDKDARGRTLWDYVGLIEAAYPRFFVLENVPGLLAVHHRHSLIRLLGRLTGAGYNVSYGVLNSGDYSVPQERKRLFIIGYRVGEKKYFSPPPPHLERVSFANALEGIDPDSAIPLRLVDRDFAETSPHQAHFYLDQHYYSYIYLSRNRVRKADGLAFTVQASGNHAQIHPKAPPMEWVSDDIYRFAAGMEHLYRRISVRESARLQTFDDDFRIVFEKITDGYRMVGNSVPVNLAFAVGQQIHRDLVDVPPQGLGGRFSGGIKKFESDPSLNPLVYSA